MEQTTTRFIRFLSKSVDTPRWGLLNEEDQVFELSCAPWKKESLKTGASYLFSQVHCVAPAEPTKILALGYNYKELFKDPTAKARSAEPHYTEPDFEPVVFLKGPNSICGPGEPIQIPKWASETWIEVEVTAVIGQQCRNLQSEAEAWDVIFGLTLGNDVTALNYCGRDWHLARSKSLDSFCPVGPYLVRGFDDNNRTLKTRINGKQTQFSTTADRVLNTAQSVQFVSRLMTLKPGDLILTGTPLGGRQSLVRPGDQIEIEVEGLGCLTNPVIEEKFSGQKSKGI